MGLYIQNNRNLTQKEREPCDSPLVVLYQSPDTPRVLWFTSDYLALRHTSTPANQVNIPISVISVQMISSKPTILLSASMVPTPAIIKKNPAILNIIENTFIVYTPVV